MEICFIADNNYKRFIKEYAPKKTEKINQGKTLNESGKTIGKNDGYINYTIYMVYFIVLYVPSKVS